MIVRCSCSSCGLDQLSLLVSVLVLCCGCGDSLLYVFQFVVFSIRHCVVVAQITVVFCFLAA